MSFCSLNDKRTDQAHFILDAHFQKKKIMIYLRKQTWKSNLSLWESNIPKDKIYRGEVKEGGGANSFPF